MLGTHLIRRWWNKNANSPALVPVPRSCYCTWKAWERFPHTQFLGDGEKGELEQGHLRLLRGLGLIQEKQVLSFLCSDKVKAPHTTSSHVDSEPDFFKEKVAS